MHEHYTTENTNTIDYSINYTTVDNYCNSKAPFT